MNHIKVTLCAGLFISLSAMASGSEIPSKFHGLWQQSSLSEPPTCREIDLDVQQFIEETRILFHEGMCVLQGIVPGGDDPLELQTYCEQEDSDWVATESWLLQTVAGTEYLTVTSTHPGYPYEIVFGRCQNGMASMFAR